MNSRNRNQWVLIFLVLIVITAVVFPLSTGHGQNLSEVDEQAKTSILSATIQIYAYSFTPRNAAQPLIPPEQARKMIQQGYAYVNAHGLGSVVELDGETSILTHNHWGSLLLEADLIEIRDASGKVLLDTNGLELRKLMRYQDAGTTILAAPQGLKVSPASLGNPDQVSKGSQVLVVHQSENDRTHLEVQSAEIKSTGSFESLVAWVLQSSGDPLRKGDSGGGVWLDGKLVGNNWATQTTINWKFWTWQSWIPEKTSTHNSYAAVYPVHYQPASDNEGFTPVEVEAHHPGSHEIEP